MVKHVIRCENCRQQSILDLPEESQVGGNILEDALCPICGAEGKDLASLGTVADLLPPLEQIARALALS